MNLQGIGYQLPKESSAGGQERRGQDTTWLRTSRPGTLQWRDHVAGRDGDGVGLRWGEGADGE